MSRTADRRPLRRRKQSRSDYYAATCRPLPAYSSMTEGSLRVINASTALESVPFCELLSHPGRRHAGWQRGTATAAAGLQRRARGRWTEQRRLPLRGLLRR